MNNDLDYRAGSVDLEIRSDGPPALTGYAVRWFDPSDPEGTQWDIRGDGSVFERALPDAFDGIEDADVVALLEHDMRSVLGRTTAGTLKLSRDDKGIRYWLDPPMTQLGKQVTESVRRRDLKASSFGMKTMQRVSRWEGRSMILEIRNADVKEISIVAFPAYKSTQAMIRSIQQCETSRRLEFERARLQLLQMGK